ncbi:iron-sulfur cluster assembly protein [Halospina denitrificans]|uniref:Iron-sulfur cluster assembly protein n=1 Tax=Halospina denitrificans TaxID=332522 RepID=A0A4R7JZ87_9GAMM|nr:iron-sulfur cluster assembly accessory protein [Halospina denitrificans]TDT43426.1 iron-sulfur cluster assembly protein [Halospina denitrificans]
MTTETVTPQTGVNMTPAAIEHARGQLRKRPEMAGIRLGTKKSGCSGFKYTTDFVAEPGSDDTAFPVADDVTVYVSHQDLPMVSGTVIDFVTEGINSVFEFRNPNATAECGCGESFAVS